MKSKEEYLDYFKQLVIYIKRFLKIVLKFLKSISFNIWIGIIIFIFVLVLFFSRISFSNNIDFAKEYYIVSEIQEQTPHKPNVSNGNYKYYIPKDYQKVDNNIFKSKTNYLEIITEDNSLSYEENDDYKINDKYDIVYRTNDIKDSENYLNMIVWDIGNGMYETLIINKDNNGVVVDIPKEKFKEDIYDIANVINSISLKENNGNKYIF